MATHTLDLHVQADNVTLAAAPPAGNLVWDGGVSPWYENDVDFYDEWNGGWTWPNQITYETPALSGSLNIQAPNLGAKLSLINGGLSTPGGSGSEYTPSGVFLPCASGEWRKDSIPIPIKVPPGTGVWGAFGYDNQVLRVPAGSTITFHYTCTPAYYLMWLPDGTPYGYDAERNPIPTAPINYFGLPYRMGTIAVEGVHSARDLVYVTTDECFIPLHTLNLHYSYQYLKSPTLNSEAFGDYVDNRVFHRLGNTPDTSLWFEGLVLADSQAEALAYVPVSRIHFPLADAIENIRTIEAGVDAGDGTESGITPGVGLGSPSGTDAGTGAQGGTSPNAAISAPMGTDAGVGTTSGTTPSFAGPDGSVIYPLADAIAVVNDIDVTVPPGSDTGVSTDSGTAPKAGAKTPVGTDVGDGTDSGATPSVQHTVPIGTDAGDGADSGSGLGIGIPPQYPTAAISEIEVNAIIAMSEIEMNDISALSDIPSAGIIATCMIER